MARITGRQSKDRGPRSTAVLRSWDVWDADTLEPFALDFELGNGKWGAGSWELGTGTRTRTPTRTRTSGAIVGHLARHLWYAQIGHGIKRGPARKPLNIYGHAAEALPLVISLSANKCNKSNTYAYQLLEWLNENCIWIHLHFLQLIFRYAFLIIQYFTWRVYNERVL